MKRFAFPVPAGWVAVSPGQFTIGDATLRVSELGPMPEDLPRYLGGQVRQLAAGRPVAPVEPAALALASGWPAIAIDATIGLARRVVIAIEVIELGVIAHLDGPVGAVEAARAAVIDALGAGAVEWGAPSQPTLAEIFAGVPRDA
ncbi:MAG: hypothetical protein K8W52_01065 [Deltaproteobacteria bacterium]|nr:hypothetical protein [Deltaproteobacteria bacterium]